MKMTILKIATLVSVTAPAFATPAAPICSKQAEAATLQTSRKIIKGDKQSNETRYTTGSRLLHKGENLETYVVGYSDETDPAEFIAVMEIKGCKVKFIGLSNNNTSEF